MLRRSEFAQETANHKSEQGPIQVGAERVHVQTSAGEQLGHQNARGLHIRRLPGALRGRIEQDSIMILI